MPSDVSYNMAEDQWIPEYGFQIDPKQTLKFTLYKLMAMCAASYICELCQALNIPIVLWAGCVVCRWWASFADGMYLFGASSSLQGGWVMWLNSYPPFIVMAKCRFSVVFESPVRSGFFMPKGFNHNCNRSAFSPEVKRPNRTTKRPQTVVFCGL